MKKNLLNNLLIGMLFLTVASCNSKKAADTEKNEATPTESAVIANDKEVLANDSTTVLTSEGVKDENANAKIQENLQREKLKADEANQKK